MSADDELVRLANGVAWPGFLGVDVPEWLERELRSGLAGVVYFAQNLHGDVAALSERIHGISPRALIGIDEEGGSVTRLETATGSTVPGAAQLGAVGDTGATRATGAEIARRCGVLGIDVVLGPVADVNTDPRNPVIGTRSFGSETALVARHTAAEVQGIQDAGLAACVKHYPGHGDTHTDSHHDLPRLELTAAQIAAVHLPPFRAAIDAGVHAVMTAHICAEEWGEEPATLNPVVLGGLRASGFTGVIITDALDMAAIRETVGIGGGAVRALAAGADLLCIGNPTNPGEAMAADQDEQDFRAARDAIVDALRDGTLPRARVEEAAARVAALAASLSRPAPDAAPDPSFDAEDIVSRAITVRGPRRALADGPAPVIDARRSSSLAVDSAASHVAEELAAGGDVVRLDAEDPASAGAAAAAAAAWVRPGILLLDRLDGSSQAALAAAVRRAAPDTIVVNTGLPVGDVPGAMILDVRGANLVGARIARRMLVGA